MSQARLRPLDQFRVFEPEEMTARAAQYRAHMERRRTVRSFSSRPVPRGVIEDCLAVALTAPSGASRQPWHFVAISDADVKARLRRAAEAEERAFYDERAGADFRKALAPLATTAEKPFLEQAPWVVAVFAERHRVDASGAQFRNYYVSESVGIATGFLVSALHHAGLAVLTYTPSPMGFLSELLGRPDNEKPYMLVITGYPAEGVQVPDLSRRPEEELVSWR